MRAVGAHERGVRVGAKSDGEVDGDLAAICAPLVLSSSGSYRAQANMGLPKWSSASGYDRVCKAASKTKYVLHESVNEDWWRQNVKDGCSHIPVVCTECGAISEKTRVEVFAHRLRAGCWCNGGILYSSEQGRLRVLSWCVGRFHPTGFLCDPDEWKARKVRSTTLLPIRCGDCGVIASVSINQFDQQRSILCQCSARYPITSSSKRKELLQAMEASRIEPIGSFVSIYDDVEWEKLDARSLTYIEGKCLDCGCVLHKTSIASFLSAGRKGCGCKNKTEARMVEIIAECLDPASDITLRKHMSVGLSIRGGSLKADAALLKDDKLIAIFECDGPQHFCNSFHDTESNWQITIKNDLLKEQFVVAHSAAVVRIFQGRLNGKDGKPRLQETECFIRKTVQQAVEGTLLPVVHCQPGVVHYTSGVYASMRKPN